MGWGGGVHGLGMGPCGEGLRRAPAGGRSSHASCQVGRGAFAPRGLRVRSSCCAISAHETPRVSDGLCGARAAPLRHLCEACACRGWQQVRVRRGQGSRGVARRALGSCCSRVSGAARSRWCKCGRSRLRSRLPETMARPRRRVQSRSTAVVRANHRRRVALLPRTQPHQHAADSAHTSTFQCSRAAAGQPRCRRC
jgi:hypothetical protein